MAKKTAQDCRIEFYGKDDARSYDHDEMYIMKAYAKAKLEEAAERARIEHHWYGNTIIEEEQEIAINNMIFSVNKDSIINTPLD